MRSSRIATFQKMLASILAFCLAFGPLAGTAQAAVTDLADSPVFVTADIPPNVMLDLSVEWPTGVVAAYNDNDDGGSCPGRTSSGSYGICYFSGTGYLGYFDPNKCYAYDTTNAWFYPTAAANASHQCTSGSGKWSGNFLNWATMQATDTFRWAMTGGDRYVDTATATVVEKAKHTGQGGYAQFPIKRVRNSTSSGVPAVDPSTVTPFSYSPLYARVTNDTTQLGDGLQLQVSSDNGFPSTSATTTYEVRVKVCDSTIGLESNCTQYGTTYKPEGLIQQNGQKMRFGITSYLLDSDARRAGGVQRSKMKDTAPQKYIPGTGLTSNSATEWSSTDGTYVANPDSADATASGVANSGVINYLNKYGKANGYKTYDTLSEMYYESLRYFKNLGPTPEYYQQQSWQTNPQYQSAKDNFPVNVTWDDPIQYSCQKNFIIGLADSNTWCDTSVPGYSSISNSGSCGGTGHMTAPSNADTTINATTLTTAVGALESPSGGVTTPLGTYSNGRGDSAYVAGLAYYANTQDLRPDVAGVAKTIGRQTVSTYFVDVRESGSWGGKNQMWLAAKYGGFDVPPVPLPPAVPYAIGDALPGGSWDKDLDGVPDNYFTASEPDVMVTALKQVFNDILTKTGAGAGAGISSPQVSSGGTDPAYTVAYNSANWTGQVFGNTIAIDATTGAVTLTNKWNAHDLLNTLASGTGWSANRKIITRSGTAGVPFLKANLSTAQLDYLAPSTLYSSLSTAQKAALVAAGYANSTAGLQQAMVEYLRGNKALEAAGTGTAAVFRARGSLLGDILGSEAKVVAAPNQLYDDVNNPGYSAFKTAVAARKKMIYVGANDGMLHAFNGETDLVANPNGGKEIWAYIPSMLLPGASGAPEVDGLQALSKVSGFQHHFYADQTPSVLEADFNRTGLNPTGILGTPDWRSLLVAGLNKGGKGFYALDVTDGATAATETAAAAKVLWEFTDADMGYSHGKPIIGKTRKYGWVVFVTSGYNNVSGTNAGQGFLYVLNAKTGAQLEKISTGVGTATDPSGLARITGYVINYADYTVEQIYGGDLKGNVWRFDVSQPATNVAAFPSPQKIAVLTDAATTPQPQPITMAPEVRIAKNNVDRWVFFGTGRFLAATDRNNAQQQTIYAIRDGDKSAPYTTATLPPVLPTALTFPIDPRSAMVAQTDLTTALTADALKPMGWYYDLTGISGAAGTATERVYVELKANEGVLAWVGNTPSVDPCSSAKGRAYAVDYDTGVSRIVSVDASGSAILDASGNTTVASFFESTSAFVKIQFVKSAGKIRLLFTDEKGVVGTVKGNYGLGAAGGVRVNWREILD